MALELYDLLFVLVGVAVLGIGLLPRVVEHVPLSKPPLYVAFGYLVFSLPLGLPTLDPFLWGEFAERLAEFGVIVALMTAGLKLDRAPGLKRWASTWRLLAVTMPLTIALTALVGRMVGLAVPTAVLLGAVVAPTDPVLASEVQVEGPEGSSEEQDHPDAAGREDEVRFALTSEAGLNDGLAFPFTYLAVSMALLGPAPGNWFGEWFLVDVLFRLAVAVVGGGALGWVLAKLMFISKPDAPLATSMLGVEALGGTLLVYGLIEFVGGYGFIAVFVAAIVLRHYERRHVYYEELHDFSEQVEQLTMGAILFLFGGLVADGLFAPATLELVAAAFVVVLVVRPLSGVVGLLGFERSWAERGAISFYGLRGIGTFYYLAFALNEAAFPGPDVVWALAGLIVLVSIVVHGVTATPVVEEWLGEGEPTEEWQHAPKEKI